MALQITESQITDILGKLKTGFQVIKDGNWQAAINTIEHGSTRQKIVTDIDVAETVTKLFAIAFPVAGSAIYAMEALKLMVVYGKGPADFGDPVWGVHTGEVEGPNPSI